MPTHWPVDVFWLMLVIISSLQCADSPFRYSSKVTLRWSKQSDGMIKMLEFFENTIDPCLCIGKTGYNPPPTERINYVTQCLKIRLISDSEVHLRYMTSFYKKWYMAVSKESNFQSDETFLAIFNHYAYCIIRFSITRLTTSALKSLLFYHLAKSEFSLVIHLKFNLMSLPSSVLKTCVKYHIYGVANIIYNMPWCRIQQRAGKYPSLVFMDSIQRRRRLLKHLHFMKITLTEPKIQILPTHCWA